MQLLSRIVTATRSWSTLTALLLVSAGVVAFDVTRGGAVAAGTIVTIAGGPGAGPALEVAQHPLAVAVATSGSTVYVLDVEPGVPGLGFSYSGTIRAIDLTTGAERDVAGDGGVSGGYRGDGGSALQARLAQPLDIAADGSGNVYVSDSANNRIRKITAGGVITTIAGGKGARLGFSGDGGPAADAAIDYPTSLAVDTTGNLYFFDLHNHREAVRVPPNAPASGPKGYLQRAGPW